MKKNIFEKLCCPEDKGELELKIVEGDLVAGVIKGSLICKECGMVYPIEDKIPRLLPKKFAEEKKLNSADASNVIGEKI